MQRGKSGRIVLNIFFATVIPVTKNVDHADYCPYPALGYLFTILFHFNSQPISSYYKIKKFAGLPQLPLHISPISAKYTFFGLIYIFCCPLFWPWCNKYMHHTLRVGLLDASRSRLGRIKKTFPQVKEDTHASHDSWIEKEEINIIFIWSLLFLSTLKTVQGLRHAVAIIGKHSGIGCLEAKYMFHMYTLTAIARSRKPV